MASCSSRVTNSYVHRHQLGGQAALQAAAATWDHRWHQVSFVKHVHAAAEPCTYLSPPFHFHLFYCSARNTSGPHPSPVSGRHLLPWDMEARQQRLSTTADTGRCQLTGGEGVVVSPHPWWRYLPAWVPSACTGPAAHNLTLPLQPQHLREIVNRRKTARLTPHPPVHRTYGPFTSPFLLLYRGRSFSALRIVWVLFPSWSKAHFSYSQGQLRQESVSVVNCLSFLLPQQENPIKRKLII